MPELDDVERIARSVEWDTSPVWELDEGLSVGADPSLAAAKRYLAAQAFLQAQKEGRVPVGWQRQRRLADYDGEYRPQTVDAAADRIGDLIEERNAAANARIARVAQDRKDVGKHAKSTGRGVSKAEVARVSAQLATFNDAFFELKGAVAKASTAVADLALRVKAAEGKV